MDIKQFARMKGLQAAHQRFNSALLDHFPEIREKAIEAGTVRRVQFETLPEFVEQLEIICDLLGCTRREFLERATLEAISKAQEEFCQAYRDGTGEDYGLPEALKPTEE